MNASDNNHLDLQQQLDEAGRLCQPRHPGWETLLERLPSGLSSPQPADQRPAVRRQPESTPPRRYRLWRAMAVAASLALAIVAGLSFWGGPEIVAETAPIEVQRRGVQVTIFSASDNREPTLFMPVADNPARSSAGMALVRDQRMILHLRKGDNLVKFTDVAATIDPTSVRLVSDTDPLGTKVIEQNFEFDLATADALLKRSLRRKVACVGKEHGELYEGYLLSYDDAGIVLADRKPSDDPDARPPKTRTIPRKTLRAVRLDHKPTDLYTRPTLVWKLRTGTPGNHLTTLTYLCGDAVWRADYVALIRETGPEGDTLDLGAWVTIDNRSGTIYDDAGLKLIAGDVNRVRDPWAPVERPTRRGGFAEKKAPSAGVALGFFARKAFIEKSFFEYKLYTLNQPSTIRDRQIKQLSLFETHDVKARRRYVCRSGEGTGRHAEVELLMKNEEENHLGRPMPKGTVTLTAIDPDGDSQLLRRQDIDHTAKDEEIKLDLGRAFDVVYGYRMAESSRPALKQMICTCEFRIRNHKPYEIEARAVAEMSKRLGFWKSERRRDGRLRWVEEMGEAASWEIIRSTDRHVKHDHKTVHFDVRVPPDSEKTIRYTVDYRW